MKRLLLTFIAALIVIPASMASGSKLTVVMHDPGCHAFLVNGHFKKSMTVKGPVTLANYDEAPLVIRHHLVKVGKSVRLTKGVYVIKMIHQAPDDNTLKLTVK